ncbi:MAG TPA: hypothetical protein VL974_06970 [Magnetospirillum sp.]|nr:hypothetical protein [Magnetospirillum sp.]
MTRDTMMQTLRSLAAKAMPVLIALGLVILLAAIGDRRAEEEVTAPFTPVHRVTPTD